MSKATPMSTNPAADNKLTTKKKVHLQQNSPQKWNNSLTPTTIQLIPNLNMKQ